MDGRFTDDLRIFVMDLLAINVVVRQIEPVIRAVMRMCKVNYDRLPQHTAKVDMLIES